MKISEWPRYTREEISSVNKILESGKVNYWTGSETKNFEKEFANFCGSKFAIGIANGSLAISSAYLSLGLNKGDEIITTPRTFIATASSAVLLGIKPIFADVEINSGNITAETIEPLINSKTKAICVVHINGWPADMISIIKIAKKYNLKIIEDCAQAHGAQIKTDEGWRSVGSFGDVAAWSFCQDKIISTAGEGGMITTSSHELFDKVWSFKDHGKTLDSLNRTSSHKGFRWLHDRFGSNFRLTEVQSGIGRIQLKNIKVSRELRTRNALIIADALLDIPLIRIPLPGEDYLHAWYKFYCYLKPEFLVKDWNRNKIIEEINFLGFPAFHGGCSEIYREECFKIKNLQPEKPLVNAKDLGENSLMFLVHPTISIEEINNYAQAIRQVCIKASK